MIEIGKKQKLTIQYFKDAGAYLGEGEKGAQTILLPTRQVPEGAGIGDELEVFIYRDSEDRLIATTRTPALMLGAFAALRVVQVTKIGAFLDWGLEKDLFLPYREQRGELKPGMEVTVSLYVDKSGRLCATMYVDKLLRTDSPYRAGDKVEGIVYGIREEIGAFVAVDGRYMGLIPRQELYEALQLGDRVNARVMRVREDGKLDLSTRKKAYAQMKTDADIVWEHLEACGGILGIGDKSPAELIKAELHLSKNAFKRAAGRLMKAGKITVGDYELRRCEKEA